eukprot:TRINITY_DN3286_c0_g2_i1.p1 TRINITY_DN3286_c0_g2~~TRINITY_DN3286_c0_g2_i1.p1  ORF type:complete len:322 (-),score=67.25 TRINITY_DN3286_c0_g2_i1:715-1680(-)
MYHERKPEAFPNKRRVRIVEVGAGAGSAADSILQFFKTFEGKFYEHLEYIIYEISPQMCEVALKKLTASHPKLVERGQVRVVNESVLAMKEKSDELTFFLLLEVLDNLPHDRVYLGSTPEQVLVEFNPADPNTGLKEVRAPLEDALIKEVLDTYLRLPETERQSESDDADSIVKRLYKRWKKLDNEQNIFLPTACYQMFKNIHSLFPQHHYVIADFDFLRGATSALAGVNAPVVSFKLAGSAEKHDYDSYLVPRGAADIFFPTNFYLLRALYKRATRRSSSFLKTADFVEQNTRTKWTETKSGYNPLREDFANTSVFFTVP